MPKNKFYLNYFCFHLHFLGISFFTYLFTLSFFYFNNFYKTLHSFNYYSKIEQNYKNNCSSSRACSACNCKAIFANTKKQTKVCNYSSLKFKVQKVFSCLIEHRNYPVYKFFNTFYHITKPSNEHFCCGRRHKGSISTGEKKNLYTFRSNFCFFLPQEDIIQHRGFSYLYGGWWKETSTFFPVAIVFILLFSIQGGTRVSYLYGGRKGEFRKLFRATQC